jgi:hypothetical protein
MPPSFWPLLGSDINDLTGIIVGLIATLLLVQLIRNVFDLLDKRSQ